MLTALRSLCDKGTAPRRVPKARQLCRILLFPLFLSFPLAGQVQFAVKSDSVAVQIDGKPFTVLHFGKQEHKPFLHPLMTPSGKNILRGFPVAPLAGESTDRPHQRGVWMGTEGLKGPNGVVEDFWENDPLYPQEHKGAIVFQNVTSATGGNDRGVLSFISHWISTEGQLWVIDRRKITFYAKPADYRMFDIEIELEAVQPVSFEDVQDTVLGFRLALPFDDHYGGKVVNAAGEVGEEGARGHRSAWLDWTAELNPREYHSTPHGLGEKVGLAVFDHPSNLNYPARWQIKNFGDFSINPFGSQIFSKFDNSAQKGGYSMKPGDKLHLRYRVVIHPEEADIQNLFKQWTLEK
jgi:hypothetical protein